MLRIPYSKTPKFILSRRSPLAIAFNALLS